MTKARNLYHLMVLFFLACTKSPDLRFADIAEDKRIVPGEPLDLTIAGLPSGVDSIQYYIDNGILDTKNGTDGLVVHRVHTRFAN